MSKQIIKYQQTVLKLLSGKIEGFYLSGGTALSLYYFHHRESLDLDFFTHKFDLDTINNIIKNLSEVLGKKIKLVGQANKKNMMKIAVYSIGLAKGEALKIDFVEDWAKVIKPLKMVDGINILSLEDIYLRKIYAIGGTTAVEDETGRPKTIGARQEAKDFFDLYCLSTIFTPLSKFAIKYGNPVLKEALVRWFRGFDRMGIKSGLLELRSGRVIDYQLMEGHFKKEINKLIEKEAGF